MAKSCFLPSIYHLCSNFVKQLFRIQIQKGWKVLLWNQLVKSRMEACYSELTLCNIFMFHAIFFVQNFLLPN